MLGLSPREEKILQLLKSGEEYPVTRLSQELGVSAVTIRGDLRTSMPRAWSSARMEGWWRPRRRRPPSAMVEQLPEGVDCKNRSHLGQGQ
jgi:hypothetical protein